MIDVLRVSLDLREAIHDIDVKIRAYGYGDEEFPELKQLDSLERSLFLKVNQLDTEIR